MRQAQLTKKTGNGSRSYRITFIDPKKVKNGEILNGGETWTVQEIYPNWDA